MAGKSFGCVPSDHPAIDRRTLVRAGGLSLIGAGLSDLLRLESQTAANDKLLPARATSVVFIWANGGPSQHETWDPKPLAPAEIRGDYQPIATRIAGLQICEHLPMMAKEMHHMSIVRSMSTREADHGRGRYYMHTGYVPNPSIDHPSYGAVIAHELWDQVKDRLEIPPFVSIGGGSEGPGFLGMTWAPFVVGTSGDVRNLNMRMEVPRPGSLSIFKV